MSNSSTNNQPTAGIIVIGDEILKGYTQDTNSHFMSKRLFQLGVKVQRISVIPDVIETIAEEVKTFSDRYTHVFTSGGVGPTHDDKTFLGVAEAFGDETVLHPQLGSILRSYFKLKDTDDQNTAPQLKMAIIPRSSELLWGVHERTGKRTPYPTVRVRNVVILPGIPSLLHRAFIQLEHKFKNSDSEFFAKKLFLDSDEFSIAETLTQISDKYAEKGVNVGSYPKIGHSYYRVKVTVDSSSGDHTDSAMEELKDKLCDRVIHYDSSPLTEALEKYEKFSRELKNSDPEFHSKLKSAEKLIESVLSQSDLSTIALSFNGGKDCTVILHLLHLAFIKAGRDGLKALPTVYIRNKSAFEEMEKFLEDSRKRYGFNLIRMEGNIKSALFHLKNSHPEIQTIFMGTRKSDLGSTHLDAIAPTDPGWPEYTRVSPLLEWTYAQIWTFLRGLWLPYCSLYDKGYTSLGSTENTQPNEALKYYDNFGLSRFHPAFKLTDETLERSGRGGKTKP